MENFIDGLIEVLVGVVLMIVLCIEGLPRVAKQRTDMLRKIGMGGRPKFIIDDNRGYDYCESVVNTWLNSHKWKKKPEKYCLKVNKDGNWFGFGFNYYNEDNRLVIEAWLDTMGVEQCLTKKVYHSGNTVAGTDAVLVGQPGKDAYIELLKTLIVIDGEIEEENLVSLVE